MPRTKKPSQKSVQFDEKENGLRKDIRDFFEAQENLLDEAYETQMQKLAMSFIALKALIGEDNLNKTIGQLKCELVLRDISNTTAMSSHSERRLGSDDGYITESCSMNSDKDGHSTTVGNTTRTRTSRSLTRNDVPRTLTKTIQRRRSRSMVPPSSRRPQTARAVYQTPAYNKMAGTALPSITPKMAPNVAPTILRQPRHGEMVVSMSGSPLMVHAQQPDQFANCNIPLFDGTVLSLLPEKFRKSQTHIPVSLMDEEVLNQLNTLKENLEAVVKAGQAKKGGKS